MAKKKATEVRRDRRRKVIAEALEEGLTYRQIQTRFKKMGFNVALGTITNDVKTITSEWRASRTESVENRVQAELVRLLELDAIAAREWEERMAGKRVRKKTKRAPLWDPDGNPIKKNGKQVIEVTEEVIEIMGPDRGYLETRRAISSDIQKLFGLPEPIKHKVDASVSHRNPILDKLEAAFDEAGLREFLTYLRKHNDEQKKRSQAAKKRRAKNQTAT